MRRFLRRFFAVVALLLVALAVWLLWPVSAAHFDQAPAPSAPTYEQAVADFNASVAGTPSDVRVDCRPQLLTHGQPTEEVFVLLHGLSNGPVQYATLAPEIFAQGHNVLIPRMPYHGETNRMTTDWGVVTANDFLQTSIDAINLAHGLGKKVTVLGLSVNGTVAGWIAQNRNDVDRSVLMSPFMAPLGVPRVIVTPAAKVLLALPNQFVWWDSAAKENLPGPDYAYPRFPTHAIASVLLLARVVLDQSEKRAPDCGKIIIVTTAADLALDNQVTAELGRNWEAHRPGVVTSYQFPLADQIPHDFVDPHQPGANTKLVYAKLLELLKGN